MSICGEQSFEITMSVVIRTCQERDLPALEWLGAYSGHREIIRETFEAHASGRAVIMVAEAQGYPIGQIWIDLETKPDTGVLWALRVMPGFQRLGVGTKLVREGERTTAAAGLKYAELAVEHGAEHARRLYQKLGYRDAGTQRSVETTTGVDGQPVTRVLELALLRKTLSRENPSRHLGPASI